MSDLEETTKLTFTLAGLREHDAHLMKQARDAALEEAAQCIEKKHTHNVLGTPHPMAISDAAAIRALKQDRGKARSEGGAA